MATHEARPCKEKSKSCFVICIKTRYVLPIFTNTKESFLADFARDLGYFLNNWILLN